MKQFSKFLALLALGSVGLSAYADASLTISSATYSPNTGSAMYANADNRIVGHTLEVTLLNSGDVDLAPGDDGYSVTLQTSQPADLQTFEIDQPLAVGEEKTFNFVCDYSVQPIYDAYTGSSTPYVRFDLRENVSGTTKINVRGAWADIYLYTVSYTLVPENSGLEVDKTINWGFVTEATTLVYRLRATGGADVVVSSIELPEGFSITNIGTPFTVTGNANAETSEDCYQRLEITFTPTTPGAKSGVMHINVEGADSKEYQLAASYVGVDSFFESFDTDEKDSYVPKGWVIGDRWSVSYKNTSSDDLYALRHSYSSEEYASFSITPKLHFSEGEGLSFQAAKCGSGARLEVYYSSDRANWVLLQAYQANYSDDGTVQLPSSTDTFGDYVVGLPEGDWYIGFRGMYCWLNNVFGGVYATVDHDVMVVASDIPAKATVNNPWQLSLSVKNMLDITEAAGGYAVELYVDGRNVAAADTPEWAGQATLDFNLSYTFHEAGDHTVYAQVTVGDVVVRSVEAVVTVNAESSSQVYVVGTAGSYTQSTAPLSTNWNNSESQMLFTEEYLAQYGIVPGMQLAGVAFDAVSSDDKNIPNTLVVWLKGVEATSLSSSEPYDLSGDSPAYRDENGALNIVNNGREPYELIRADFESPFVYNGGSLLLSVRSEASTYKTTNYYYDSSNSNAIYRRNDNYESFLSASWSNTSMPITKFLVYKQPAQLAGTLTDSKGNALAGIEVKLTSGDVVYSGTTDENGYYSIEVFQADLTYTVEVDSPDYPVYTDEVSFAGGNPSGNITLADFSTSRDYRLSINVTTATGMSLEGKQFTLSSDRFSINYPVSETVLDENGSATLNVYGGWQTLTISIPGMKTVTRNFSVNKDTTVDVALDEDVRTPYGTSYQLDHDIYTGENTVTLSWNGDEALFEDSFEDYDAFAVDFAPWTGIDVDNAPAAALQGDYNNRGVVNYGQIINPMAVDPIWDPVQYPHLMARTGMQYAGFIQTSNNVPNNDWLITPAITLGEDNVVRFSIKSGDAGNARFTVGVTTVDNPTANDFIQISEGNYLEVAYDAWQTVEISLAEYAGQTVKIGFHCISASGAFISQLDDVFVGRVAAKNATRAHRVALRSAANPNEKFVVMLDGEVVGETEDYSFILNDVKPGRHVARIVATYLSAEAEPVDIPFEINADDYVKADFAVTTNNGVVPESVNVRLTSEAEDAVVYNVAVVGGAASVASLPKDKYEVAVAQEFYDLYTVNLDVVSDTTVSIALKETIVAPFNIAHDVAEHGEIADVTVTWNNNFGFEDSFEDYADFATGSFGGWTTVDNNTEPSYPIGLGSMSNIVTFPGCSTSQNPASVPPMVFNPATTVPSMAADAAVAAPDGVKSILFQGPQGAVADKWLISPQIAVREGYEMSVAAKAYTFYPETLELLISETDVETGSFTVLDVVQPGYEMWTQYTIDLSAYAGKDVYLAVHCTSYDGFLVQVDSFRVGREGGEEVSALGYVKSYDVTLNGEEKGSVTEPQTTFTGLTNGSYTVGVRSVYASGVSEYVTYGFTLEGLSGLESVETAAISVEGAYGAVNVVAAKADVTVLTVAGVVVASQSVEGSASIAVAPGVYIVKAGNVVRKVTVK